MLFTISPHPSVLLCADAEEEEQQQQHEGKHFKDCPITFSSTAARRCMPLSLLELSGQHDRRWQHALTRKLGGKTMPHGAGPGDSYRSGSYASRSPGGGSYADLATLEPLPAVAAVPAPQPVLSSVKPLDAPHVSKFAFLAEEHDDASGSAAEPERSASQGSDLPADGTVPAAGALPDTAGSTPEPRPAEEKPPTHAEPISVQLAERIWATVLSLSVMQEMDVCWLVDDEEEPERTVVDAGREWLEARAEEDERIKELLESGELQKAAKRAIRDWKRIMENSVAQLRKNDVLNRFTALTHVQRASGRIIKSMMTDHGTFATFLDADGYIMRWQRFMILITIVMSTLLVSIWFYSSRGTQCCQEIRAMLDMGAGQVCGATPPPAPPMSPSMPPLPPAPFTPPGVLAVSSDSAVSPSGCPPVGPCLGFTGGCNDIPEQFIDLAGCYYYGDPGAEEYHEYLVRPACRRARSAAGAGRHATRRDAVHCARGGNALTRCAGAHRCRTNTCATPSRTTHTSLTSSSSRSSAWRLRCRWTCSCSTRSRLRMKWTERLSPGSSGAACGRCCWERRRIPSGTSPTKLGLTPPSWPCSSSARTTPRGLM